MSKKKLVCTEVWFRVAEPQRTHIELAFNRPLSMLELRAIRDIVREGLETGK